MMRNNDFAAFIMTHGRADRVYTYNTLRKSGYTGKIYIVIDDEDKTADEYRKRFGDEVVMFSKAEAEKTFDVGDNFSDRRTVVFARNAVFEIAKNLGIKYFVELDDDYEQFRFKFDGNLLYKDKNIKSLDRIFDAIVDFYKKTPAKAIAIAQGGDFVGGAAGSFGKQIKLHRKAMNAFFCSTDRPFKFSSRINEDVVTYTSNASRGDLFFTIPNVMLNQKSTQSNAGGMTDIYLDLGTYPKSFYSVIFCPSAIKIALMGQTSKRIHHKVKYNHCCPKILNEKYRKE